jgi:hypothetical protein
MTEDEELMQVAAMDFEVGVRAQSRAMGLLRLCTTPENLSTISIQQDMELGYLDGLSLKEIWQRYQPSIKEPS